MVQLELVHRQAAQVGERRIAGAEVVDGDLDAHCAQGIQGLERCIEVVHQHRLGDFELEVVERHADDARALPHAFGEARIVELHARQIHGNGHRRQPLFQPRIVLNERGDHDPFPDVHDHAGFLRHANEMARREQA